MLGFVPHPNLLTLTRAPRTRPFHSGNFAGLLHVSIWKQFKNMLLGLSLFAFVFTRQVINQVTNIRGDILLVIILPNKIQY